MPDKIGEKRFRKRLIRRALKKSDLRDEMSRAYGRSRVKRKHFIFRDPKSSQITFDRVVDVLMPDTVTELLGVEKSVFFRDRLQSLADLKIRGSVVLEVPRVFSVIDEPEKGYAFIARSMAMILYGKNSDVRFDYSRCERVDVGAQAMLDLILIDLIAFFRKCVGENLIRKKFKWVRKMIGATNIHQTKQAIQELLRSIGSLAVFREKESFSNIVPCTLTSFRRDHRWTNEAAAERKEVETTRLVEYIENSLVKVNKHLTPEKLDNLSIVIGEALANAEEHSSTKRRISIGYFRLDDSDSQRVGVFRLVILNFGATIYEKFADPSCPNPNVVNQMRALSSRYTSKGFFNTDRFGEEELWTLYALQEGVTSIAPDERRRGKGTIRYIENFFDIKGVPGQDNVSRMTILSGHTRITFDGKYRTEGKAIDGEEFRVMTFNESGTLEQPPDSAYVEETKSYFPGVLISARILLQQDDLINAKLT